MNSHRVQRRVILTLEYVFCVVLTLLVLVPLYISVMGGLKSQGQLMLDPLGLPSPAYFNQYSDLLVGKVGTFWQSLVNSLVVAAGTVALTLAVGTLAAFALARLKFRGNGVFFNYFMLGLLFPLAVAILPLYLQIRNVGLLDNYLGVILPQVAFAIPMTVLLLRGFFLSIPVDLEDACSIDGYGPLGFLFFMVLPLSTPILATTAVLALIGSWNNFFLPLLVFNKESLFTLPLGVMNFQGQHASDWQLILGYLTLVMLPAIVLFITAQRYIVAGLTGGAIKG
jgi:raffinose/stachyose/melibiose transport system permease protein